MQADACTLAVEQMRLGDHAFAHYADDNVRWQVPAAFTQRGLGSGEKVIIMGDPVALLERPGELAAWHSAGEVRLIGDGDLLTRPAFRDAVRAALAAGAGGWVLVDLSRVCFMSAGCAADLLRLIAQADGYDHVVVRCAGLNARTLRHLGAAGIGRLVLDEAADR